MKNFFCLFLIGSSIFYSCAPTRTIVNTSCSGYKNVDFNRSMIIPKKIGIMPVLGGDEKEQYRRPTGDEITKSFKQEFGQDNVKSPTEVITSLNNEGLTDEYTKSISNYSASGILPKEMITKIGHSLGVGYLLYTRLLSNSEVGFVSTGYYGSQIISIDEIYVQCQIWDTNIGDIVWEGKGGVAKLNQNTTNVIQETAEGLKNVVGKEMNQGPCETKKQLFDSVQQAHTNTYLAVCGVSLALSLLILIAL